MAPQFLAFARTRLIRQNITFDPREASPHPWVAYLPSGWQAERGTLETGDVVLAAFARGRGGGA